MTLKWEWKSSPWASEEGERKGSVDVQGYQRKVQDLPLEHTECALSTACVTEAVRVLVANVAGLFRQGCICEWHGVARGDRSVSPLLPLSMLLMFERVYGTS